MKRSIHFLSVFFVFILISSSTNLYAQSSGLLLGVNVSPVQKGLLVATTIPHTPADGVLYRGDILRFMTAYGHPVYSVQRLSHLEKAKKAIGPNRDAFLEVLRNGNRMFFRVSFLRSTVQTYGMSSSPPVASSLRIAPALGSEASSLFGNDASSSSNNYVPRPNNSGGVHSNIFD
ncbi:MAG: hypothetical protein D3918_09935 [Candidatus Electrothrix sp. AX2]|nr:hypothetical protein [Candidatus Electrothrix gigas]